MKIKEYFNRLPNYLSANFFALLGFTNFVYPILAAMVTFFYSYNLCIVNIFNYYIVFLLALSQI